MTATTTTKKRRNDSIRQRGATFTCYWWVTDPATGRRKQYSRGGFRTIKEAKAHRTSVMAKVQRQEWAPDRKMTVGELLDQYVAARTSEGLRPGTVALYRNTVRAWLKPRVGGLALVALNPAVAQGLADQLRVSGSTQGRGGLSTRSVQVAMTLLRAATKWAAHTGLVMRDPLTGYRPPKSKSATMTVWSAEQVTAFLGAVADDRLAAAWRLFLVRGPRRGEVAGLRWSDVDLTTGEVAIRRTRIVIDGRAEESDPKTEAGRRTLPGGPDLVAALEAHWLRQQEERMAAGEEAWADTGHVFVNELGEPYHPDHFAAAFERLILQQQAKAKAEDRKAAPRIRLHDTRHTAATLWLQVDPDLFHLAKMLGHSSTRMVEKTYGHAVPARVAEGAARIDQLIRGGAEVQA